LNVDHKSSTCCSNSALNSTVHDSNGKETGYNYTLIASLVSSPNHITLKYWQSDTRQ